MGRFSCWLSIVPLLAACSSLQRPYEQPNHSPGPVRESGSFQIVTYNIGGLPELISRSNPSRNTQIIGRLLNTFDLVLVQEDFFYHGELLRASRHPFRSEPYEGWSIVGDGLNQLSVFPFSSVRRESWTDCNGYISASMDCWASKGFTFSRVKVAQDVEIDVYNLHFDAGGSKKDDATRRSNINQLLQRVQRLSADRAVIIGGDTNLDLDGAADEQLLEYFHRMGNLRIACRETHCRRESKDRLLFRSGRNIQLDAVSWSVPTTFVDKQGVALSDHEPVAVTYLWKTIKP
jgi:endonuclease/exonuclease/phosphatase family metal-dependent hydrolase